MLAKMACETQDSCSIYTSQLQWWKAQQRQTVFPHGSRPQTALSEAVESSSDRFRKVRRRHGPEINPNLALFPHGGRMFMAMGSTCHSFGPAVVLLLFINTSYENLPCRTGFPQTPPFVTSVTYHIRRHTILGKEHQSMCTCVGMHIHVRTCIICAYVFM